MNRRGFLSALAAVAVAPFVPAAPAGLRFRPDAFALVMQDLPVSISIAHQFGVDFAWDSFDKTIVHYRSPLPGGFMRYIKASAEAEGRS